ncbi:MAG: CpsD/CapB family tyrosine-protein kinase [bacterium]|nr:CpsD/CapB family tyrosine-protein kinase [bacterium]
MSFIERALERAARERKKNEALSAIRPKSPKPSVDFHELDPRIQAMMEDRTDAFEQYKLLRTMILNASQQNGERLVLVTSAVSGEGKTTTSVNLAISIAQSLQETALLIDCDLRNPQVHKMLGLERVSFGLANFLRHEVDLPQVLLKTSIPKLSLLPAGPPPENPSELINSRTMSIFLEEAKERYQNRLLIIDSPPINQFTDALILSLKVDGVLLVARAGKTRMNDLEAAVAKLKKANLIGIVLNSTDRLSSRYYYYY